MFEPTVDATKLCEADFIIVSVPTPHKEIVDINIEAISSKLVKGGLYVDVKSTMNKTQLESRGFKVWRL
jgi:UDP-N-acetyl-D-galactosamine dehydrogenase